MEDKKSIYSSVTNPRAFLAFLFVTLLITAAVSYSIWRPKKESRTTTPKTQKSSFTSLSNNSVAYGFWEGSSSFINAFDLNSGKIYKLAELPANIKKVLVLSPQKLLFIANTDVRDHGNEISVYDVSAKTATPIVSAETGFGIDDYVISPNKRYLATWEVSIPPTSAFFLGSKSRVYAVDLNNPSVKHLLYDEVASPGFAVHYPLAATNTGEIFLDRFEANTDAGWANDMSFSNLDGTVKQELEAMKRGTYSTQPYLSPDGTFLAFAGYDSSRGQDNENVIGVKSRGFRKAILNPNTTEILDVATKNRIKLSGLSNQDRYTYVGFDPSSGKILYSKVSKTPSENGWYLYDRQSSTSRKLDVARLESGTLGGESALKVLATLKQNKFLVVNQDVSAAATGNLGEKYGSSLTQMLVYDPTSAKSDPLVLNQGLFQYISLHPAGYFDASGAQVSETLQTGKTGAGQQLQLQTFTMKPGLEPQRIQQQSLPLCRQLVDEQCNSMLGTNYEFTEGYKDPRYFQCLLRQFSANRIQGVCMNSPLYIYGQEGTKLNVKINTTLVSPIPSYSSQGYDVELGSNGSLNIKGKSYSSIKFDFEPAMGNLVAPAKGRIVKSSELSNAIWEYAHKLGLNNRETKDLAKDLEDKIHAPYVFVSFYNDKVSKQILPITFNPTPDVYQNIVFYIKEYIIPPLIAVEEPEFVSRERHGITAIEVSYVIE